MRSLQELHNDLKNIGKKVYKHKGKILLAAATAAFIGKSSYNFIKLKKIVKILMHEPYWLIQKESMECAKLLFYPDTLRLEMLSTGISEDNINNTIKDKIKDYLNLGITKESILEKLKNVSKFGNVFKNAGKKIYKHKGKIVLAAATAVVGRGLYKINKLNKITQQLINKGVPSENAHFTAIYLIKPTLLESEIKSKYPTITPTNFKNAIKTIKNLAEKYNEKN